jgi:hypothetical protein
LAQRCNGNQKIARAETKSRKTAGFSGAGFQVGIKVLTGENIPLSKVYGD